MALLAACGWQACEAAAAPAVAPSIEAASGARVGVQVKVETFHSTDAQAIQAAGFSFVRLGIWTNRLHDAAYRKRVRAAFTAADQSALPVLITLRSTQPLIGDTANPSRSAALEAAGKQFAESVLEVEREFGRQIIAIELWNEPDLDKYWPTGNASVTFAPFMGGVCAELAARPHAVPIYGFGFSRAPVRGTPSDTLLREVARAQPLCVDAISYHAYGMTPSAIRSAAQDIRARYGVPAVITEWGVPSAGIVGSEAEQARLIRYFLLAVQDVQTPLVSIYEWKDTLSGSNARERSFGLVDAAGNAKPSLEGARAVLPASLRKTPAR
ncbi:MAG TPA: hypothetical protein VGL08_21450 [Paraburkholderia sp.]|jgi:hypothetical protein